VSKERRAESKINEKAEGSLKFYNQVWYAFVYP